MDYSIPTYHIYQVWNSTGQYLGVLQHVTSEFSLIQDLNTLGPSSITIKIAQSGDTASMPVKAITSEAGELLLTEDGKVITTEGEPTNFGVTNAKVKNGNIIKITEYSSYHPNGLLVFTGKVKKWNVRLGSSDDMSVVLYPLSTDLNDHIVKGSEVNIFDQSTGGATTPIYDGTSTVRRSFAYRLGVVFAGFTNVSSITLNLKAQNGSAPTTVSVSIMQENGSVPLDSNGVTNFIDNGTVIGTPATVVVSATSSADYLLSFPTPIPIDATKVTWLVIKATGTSGNGAELTRTTSDVLGGNYLWYLGDPTVPGKYGSIDGSISALYLDIPVKVWTIPDYTKIVMSNFDPGAEIRKFMGKYTSEAGVVTFDTSTVALTGITIPSYTFTVNTIHEGIKTMLDFAPQGFYYTVDPGTNVLTFKKISTTPDHLIIFKRHIQELDLSGTIENVKNAAYFTGGLVSGSNIFRYKEDAASKAQFGINLQRLNDVKVLTNGTADSRINNYIDKHNDEEFETFVKVIDGMEDITKYKPGHTVGIRGTGVDLVDQSVLPIVRVERLFGYAKLYLGILPLREQDIINDSQEQILAIQTVANPNQPS